MNMRDVQLGQRVRLKSSQVLYGGMDYAGHDFATAPTGAVGIVGAIDVPPVIGNKGNFCCVDFQRDQVQFNTEGVHLRGWESLAMETQQVWRAGVRPSEFEEVTP